MRIGSQNSDEATLAELGERLARTRLERNLDQRQLAVEAGVSKRTVERLEDGEPVRMSSFVRVMRALDLLDRLDQLGARGPSQSDRAAEDPAAGDAGGQADAEEAATDRVRASGLEPGPGPIRREPTTRDERTGGSAALGSPHRRRLPR